MDYVDVTYRNKPFTNYPDYLTGLLERIFDIEPDDLLLDVGCGRGEYLAAFRRHGIDAYGVDKSESALRNYGALDGYVDKVEFNDVSLEPEREYDFVFCKSVLEHMVDPDLLMQHIWSWLKPGGRAIIMTPDFKSAGVKFWYDYDHRRPFTVESLADIMTVWGFRQVATKRFYQVPILWHWPMLKWILVPLAKILPPWWKWVVHAGGPMVIGTGVR